MLSIIGVIYMGKDLKGKELGKGIRQRANGLYEARYSVNKKSFSF